MENTLSVIEYFFERTIRLRSLQCNGVSPKGAKSPYSDSNPFSKWKSSNTTDLIPVWCLDQKFWFFEEKLNDFGRCIKILIVWSFQNMLIHLIYLDFKTHVPPYLQAWILFSTFEPRSQYLLRIVQLEKRWFYSLHNILDYPSLIGSAPKKGLFRYSDSFFSATAGLIPSTKVSMRTILFSIEGSFGESIGFFPVLESLKSEKVQKIFLIRTHLNFHTSLNPWLLTSWLLPGSQPKSFLLVLKYLTSKS